MVFLVLLAPNRCHVVLVVRDHLPEYFLVHSSLPERFIQTRSSGASIQVWTPWFVNSDSCCISVLWAAQPPECSQYKLRRGGNTELIENAEEVILHGVFADPETLRNLFIGVAGHDG